MNVLTIFRKPQLAIFLAATILFASCSQDEEVIFNNDSNQISLEQTVEKHIVLADNLSAVFLNESNIDLDLLENPPNDIKNEKQLSAILTKANVKNVDEVIRLFNQVQQNINSYLETSESYKKMNEQNLIAIFSDEITRQKEDLQVLFMKNDGPCEDKYKRAGKRCTTNYVISVAAIGLGTFISAGTATGPAYFGLVVAAGIYAKCNNEAVSDYRECKGA